MPVLAKFGKRSVGFIEEIRYAEDTVSVLQLVGFSNIADKMGIRAAKYLLKLSNPAFYRLKKDLKNLDANRTTPRFSILKAVKEQIKEFIPVVADDIVNTDLLKKV